MKIALLAASALALVAVPAMAQETTTTTMPPAGQTMPGQTMPGQTMPDSATTTTQDPAMQQGQTMSPDPAMQQGQTMTPPAAGQPMNSGMGSATGQMTPGGYAPSGSPMMGTPQPGAQVVFRPSTPVAQAFPAPAPQESYPMCSRTVTDNCRQPGSR